VRRADNLTTFMCRLSTNLGASTSWSPQGLSRPVMGLLKNTYNGKWSQLTLAPRVAVVVVVVVVVVVIFVVVAACIFCSFHNRL
jgi:hypothetical protein